MEENKSLGILGTVPAVYISAALSPAILPIASMTPAKIPGTALGDGS